MGQMQNKVTSVKETKSIISKLETNPGSPKPSGETKASNDKVTGKTVSRP